MLFFHGGERGSNNNNNNNNNNEQKHWKVAVIVDAVSISFTVTPQNFLQIHLQVRQHPLVSTLPEDTTTSPVGGPACYDNGVVVCYCPGSVYPFLSGLLWVYIIHIPHPCPQLRPISRSRGCFCGCKRTTVFPAHTALRRKEIRVDPVCSHVAPYYLYPLLLLVFFFLLDGVWNHPIVICHTKCCGGHRVFFCI